MKTILSSYNYSCLISIKYKQSCIANLIDENALRCDLRACIFQIFPGGHVLRLPSKSMLCMLSVLDTLAIYIPYG